MPPHLCRKQSVWARMHRYDMHRILDVSDLAVVLARTICRPKMIRIQHIRRSSGTKMDKEDKFRKHPCKWYQMKVINVSNKYMQMNYTNTCQCFLSRFSASVVVAVFSVRPWFLGWADLDPWWALANQAGRRHVSSLWHMMHDGGHGDNHNTHLPCLSLSLVRLTKQTTAYESLWWLRSALNFRCISWVSTCFNMLSCP